MDRKPSVQSFTKTSLPLILSTIVILGVLYMYTLASFLARPPSEGFSREVAVVTVDSGFISNIQTPVVTVVNSDDTLTVVAIDGHVTTFVSIDGSGTVTDRFHLDLDLYKASQLDAYKADNGTMVLYYIEDDLYSATVDMKMHSYHSRRVEPQVRSFVSNGSLLVLEKANGLFGYDTNRAGPPVTLAAGEILDYAAAIEDQAFHVLAGIRNDDAMDLRAIVADSGFKEIKDTLILGRTRDSYLKTIQDVFVQDQVMTGLYVWTDKKYDLNHLTVQRIDLNDGTILDSFSNSFEIHKGRFIIDEVRDGQVSVLMQDQVLRGVNLVKATLEHGREPQVVPLTKTRELSQLSGYADLGKEKVLVFWDTIRATRAVKFASTKAAVVKATTSLLTVNYLSLAGITLMMMLAAAFIGTIPYLLFTSIIPLLIMLAMMRFTKEYHDKAAIQNAVSGAAAAILKLFLTWHLIHGMGHFDFRPALIGREPMIYLALAASSVVSWLISCAYLRNNRKDGSVVLNSFVVFLFSDYVQYIMMVLVYVGSAMILDKI